MATNKNALIRYKILDNCFRNTGRKYFIDDLIEECSKVLMEIDPNSSGISRRQVLDDIAFMESSEGWSVELTRTTEMRRVYFRYSDPDFSINNMPLNEVEITQLKSAIEILSQFKGMPQFEWINELIPKLSQGIIAPSETDAIIQFDNNQYLTGIENIGPLYSAIHYKKVLRVKYQPHGVPEPFEITFHPYFLKQYNNRWFVFGLNEANDKPDWNLALDRIKDISEVARKYKKNTTIEWNEYFDDIIGVTKPESGIAETVLLHFSATTGRYIESKPIHGSQKQKWVDNQTLEVKLSVMHNYELESVILSFGDNVVVKKPLKLRKQISARLTKTMKQYQ